MGKNMVKLDSGHLQRHGEVRDSGAAFTHLSLVELMAMAETAVSVMLMQPRRLR
jgi:hypothetical protein